MSGLARVLLVLHVAGATVYWTTQPRGFSPGRAFVEHELIVPAVFAISFAALLETWLPRVALTAAGALAGFQVAVPASFALAGDTVFSRALLAVVAVAVVAFLGTRRRVRRSDRSTRPLWGGAAAGMALGAAFIYCTWAPPPSTRPAHRPGDPVPSVAAAGQVATPAYRVSAHGPQLLVEHLDVRRPSRVTVTPALDFVAASANGTWTLFQGGPITLPAWRADGNASRFRAVSDDMEAEALAWVASGRVYVRSTTTLKRDIAAHLASAVRVQLPPGAITVDGIPWTVGHAEGAAAEFLAFRHGQLELLRASTVDSGPFTLVRAWAPRDPVVEAGGWTAQVAGWAAQASREESPTAGWGVSQGTIERVGPMIIWSLASTSIGRGWHTVRTGAGTYVLEIVLSRRS